MLTVRLLTTVLLCLGLAVPGAHGVVLCLNEHGELTLELSLDGTCAGAQESPSREGERSERTAGFERAAVGCYSGCRDVSLNPNDTAPLSPDSVTRRALQAGGAVETPVACAATDNAALNSRVHPATRSLSIHAPPICRTVVLQL